MPRTIVELAKDIQIEATEPHPNLRAIRMAAQQIEKQAPADLGADSVWSRMGKAANETKAREIDAARLLGELVALKRIRQQLDTMSDEADMDKAGRHVALSAEYARRKPLAWAAAMLLFPEGK